MGGLGSGQNGQFTFLDAVSLISFLIGVMNLNENLSQNDKQVLVQELNKKAEQLLTEIHTHLENQDKKLDKILGLLEARNDS